MPNREHFKSDSHHNQKERTLKKSLADIRQTILKISEPFRRIKLS